jgi:hypothetical protein
MDDSMAFHFIFPVDFHLSVYNSLTTGRACYKPVMVSSDCRLIKRKQPRHRYLPALRLLIVIPSRAPSLAPLHKSSLTIRWRQKPVKGDYTGDDRAICVQQAMHGIS